MLPARDAPGQPHPGNGSSQGIQRRGSPRPAGAGDTGGWNTRTRRSACCGRRSRSGVTFPAGTGAGAPRCPPPPTAPTEVSRDSAHSVGTSQHKGFICRTSGVCCSFYFLNKGHFSNCGASLVSLPTSKTSLGEAAGHSLAHAEHIPDGKEEMVA